MPDSLGSYQGRNLRTVSLETARAYIAAAFDSNAPSVSRLGLVTLYEHQRRGAERLVQILRRHRGAFLCDAVGLGKTYTALAVAQRLGAFAVICPAALRKTWRTALEQTDMSARVHSHESLSRKPLTIGSIDLLIVDEAHHFRNPATRRYAALASLCATTPILLISATPIHNSRADITSLAALFAGSLASGFTETKLGELIVRRFRARESIASVPLINPTRVSVTKLDWKISEAILNLPPPIPARHGAVAATLVTHGLLRQWSSSHAALATGLRRRIERARIMRDEITAGRHPTREQLRAWIIGDDSTQLTFAELLGSERVTDHTLQSSVTRHLDALYRIRSLLMRSADRRIDSVRSIASIHPHEKIVAFTTYAATARALYRALFKDRRVALVTASGGEIASGRVSRDEVLRAFAPLAAGASTSSDVVRVDILVTTDLLGEGINLQDASIVIHVDLPWTAARLQQREGRLARMGSLHSHVTVHHIRPPAHIERALHNLEIIARKQKTALEVVGDARIPANCSALRYEDVSEIVSHWRHFACTSAEPVLSGVTGSIEGALALVKSNGDPMLLFIDHIGNVSTGAAEIIDALRIVGTGTERSPPPAPAARALDAVTKWSQSARAASLADVGASLSHTRHTVRRRTALRRAAAGTAASSFADRAQFAQAENFLKHSLATPMPIATEGRLLKGEEPSVQLRTQTIDDCLTQNIELIALVLFTG